MNKNTSFDLGVSSKLKDIIYVSYTENDYKKIANFLAFPYETGISYDVGDFVIYKNNIYECKINILLSDNFDITKWEYLCQLDSNKNIFYENN